MFKRLLLLSALFVCALSAVSLSVPAVDNSSNSITVGTAYISWGSFIDNSGNPVQAGAKTVSITGGTLAVSLTASDNAGYVYHVLIMGGKAPASFLWKVPSAGASTIAAMAYVPPPVSGDCAQYDSNGKLVDAGAPCGSGGSGNATELNGASVPLSATCLITNSSGQLVPCPSGAFSLSGQTGSTPSTPSSGNTTLYFPSSGGPGAVDANGTLYQMPVAGSTSGVPLNANITPPPVLSNWTTLGTATTLANVTWGNTGQTAIELTVPVDGGSTTPYIGIYKSWNGTDTVTAKIATAGAGGEYNSCRIALLLSTATGTASKFVSFGVYNNGSNGAGARVITASDTTAAGGFISVVGTSQEDISQTEWYRIRVSGGNWIFEYSPDGTSWLNYATETANSYITPDSAGFFCQSASASTGATGFLLSWAN